jgi:glycosyltransferase involved in cell wall biosynthesis
MICDTERCPVIWALGRKGYMVQYPLLVALNVDGKALAVTAAVNIHLHDITHNANLLLSINTPTDIFSLFNFFFYLRRSRRELLARLKERVSVVHVIMISPWDVFFLSTLKNSGCPLVVTIHDAKQHIGEESLLHDKLRDWMISGADYVAVLSSYVARTLELTPKFNKPIRLVSEGLVMRTESPLAARKCPVGRPMRLLFHGRIHAYKGLDLLLDAMGLLRAEGAEHSLTIAGPGELGPYRDRLEKLAGISINNHFMSDSELLEMLAVHDVAVLPYREASQSAVAIDALWAALPSVATPVGALPLQFKNGIDALITDTASAAAIACSIKKLCSNEKLYETLSAGARDSFLAAGPKMAATQWSNLYDSVIDKD